MLRSLVLVAVLLVVVGMASWGGFVEARKRGDLETAVAEAHELYRGLERYFEMNRAYPNAHEEVRFDLTSLEPLVRRGYYRGRLPDLLLNGSVDAYDSPDDRGPDHEFWLEMTLAIDPTVRLLVVKSDDAPMGGGDWLEGVFVARGAELEAR